MNDGLFNESGYKKYIIFFVIFFVVIIFLFFFFLINKKDYYLIINESSIITKNGLKYKQVKKYNSKILDNVYNVYSDDKLYRDINIKNDSNEWYYFDKDYNDLSLNRVSLAYTDSFKKLKAADYDVSYYDENDDVFLTELVGDKISDYRESVIKSSFDIDGDGVVESIYTISDLGLADSKGSSSYIFLVRNNKIVKVIDKDLNNSFLVQNIVDIDGDGKYELIVSNGTSDVVTLDTCVKIYSVAGNKSKCILKCD